MSGNGDKWQESHFSGDFKIGKYLDDDDNNDNDDNDNDMSSGDNEKHRKSWTSKGNTYGAVATNTFFEETPYTDEDELEGEDEGSESQEHVPLKHGKQSHGVKYSSETYSPREFMRSLASKDAVKILIILVFFLFTLLLFVANPSAGDAEDHKFNLHAVSSQYPIISFFFFFF